MSGLVPGGEELVPKRPAGAVTPGSRGDAPPIEYTFDGSYVCLDDALAKIPDDAKSAAFAIVPNDECGNQRHWFADNKDGVWRLVLVGQSAAVLVSRSVDQQAKPTRYVFRFAPASVQSRELTKLPPAESHRGGEGAHVDPPLSSSTVDAPPNWELVFGNFPHLAQDALERFLPPGTRALRWCAGVAARDSSWERLWALAGTKRRFAYLYAHRRVPVDPFGGVEATERHRLARPWDVFALRSQCVVPGEGAAGVDRR